MDRVVIITLLLALFGYGFLKLSARLGRCEEKFDFSVEFLKKLNSYIDSGGRNLDDYGWMTHRSNKMQSNLGGLGIIHNYKPPYQNITYNNYPIILNMLPDFRSALDDEVLRGNVARQYANALVDSLVRHIGIIEDQLDFLEKEIKNPIKWLREGVREVVSFPAHLLSWFGIISESMVTRVVYSTVFKMMSGLVAMVGFLSAIVTIVIGWEQFLTKATSLLTNG